jgi:hypothetical protein
MFDESAEVGLGLGFLRGREPGWVTGAVEVFTGVYREGVGGYFGETLR